MCLFLSSFILVREIVRDLLQLVRFSLCHTPPVLDHLFGPPITVDHYLLLPLDPGHEVQGVLRERRGRHDLTLPRPDVIHAADESLDDRPRHCPVPPLGMDANHVVAELVLLDHTVDAAIARLPRTVPCPVTPLAPSPSAIGPPPTRKTKASTSSAR
jgi:hypothetical protein